MAGLPWIPLDVDFPESRKAIALGIVLQDERAWDYVVRLWTKMAKHAPEGFVNGPAAVQTIERWAGWKGEVGGLVDALALPHIRLIDHTSDGFKIHDWDQHCGAHVKKREQDRERMKRLRSERSAKRSQTVHEQSPNVQRKTDTETERETENNNAPAPRPMSIHLQGQCPSLADLLKQAAWVSPGKRAALWGEAEALVNQVGAAAALACWIDARNHREGDPGDVPLAYLIHPLRKLAMRPPLPPPEPEPEPGCPEWAEAREAVRERLNPDAFRQWVLPLRGRVRDGRRVLMAPNEFHRDLVVEKFGELLTGWTVEAA